MTLLGVPRQLAVSLLPVVLAVAALTASLLLGGAGAAFPASGLAAVGLAVTFVLALALGSLHRPLGGPGLGLGAATLPGAILVLGPTAAAGVAVAGALLGGVGRRLLREASPAAPDERRGLLRLAEGSARAALATLAAGAGWTVAGEAAGFSWRAAGVGGGAYVAVFALLVLGAEELRRPRRTAHGHRPRPGLSLRFTSPLAIDAAGWAVGAAIARVGDAVGWGLATALLWAVALLATEAARLGFLQGEFERRAIDLARVSRASHRMAVSGFGLSGLAAQLRSECLRLLDLHWFQLALYPDLSPPGSAGETVQSWWAGPDGVLHGGTPEPAPAPPPMPGIHRRRPWRLVERELSAGDRRLARLRLWCDPRRVRPGEIERLDSLLPQLATWVHRALLDREAREDPLTGVPTRRHLERVLAEAFARAWEGGGRVAVVLADLDHFKRIN
ncbi:MAG TPA: diguanylate cyclase, partial [Thermoanaerobaculia bacterium]|nr:diguanylate cyclase [Thermoanaerobaculia bacterium]